MSMYPPGVTTALVTAGTAIDFAGSPARTISVKVTPSLGGMAKSITHEATGGDMGISVLSYSSDDTGVVSFELPHTDQPGWVDGMQRPVPGWAYKADITINLPGGTLNKTKNFTIPSGQDHIDLDRIADGQIILGVTAPAEVVSSVAGLTGAISRAALAEALGTVSGGGEGGTYDDSELRQRVEDLEDRPNPDFGQFVQQAALSSLYTQEAGTALEIRVDALEAAPDAAAYDDGPLTARVAALEQAPPPVDLDVSTRRNRVSIIGDSFSSPGYGSNHGHIWHLVAMSHADGIFVGNYAANGHTAADAIEGRTASWGPDLPNAQLTKAKADASQSVIVCLGYNDQNNSVPRETFYSNMRRIARELRTAGKQTVIVQPPIPIRARAAAIPALRDYLADLPSLCDEEGAIYLRTWDLIGDELGLPPEYDQGDGSHMTAAGHDAVGRAIAPRLRRAIEGLGEYAAAIRTPRPFTTGFETMTDAASTGKGITVPESSRDIFPAGEAMLLDLGIGDDTYISLGVPYRGENLPGARLKFTFSYEVVSMPAAKVSNSTVNAGLHVQGGTFDPWQFTTLWGGVKLAGSRGVASVVSTVPAGVTEYVFALTLLGIKRATGDAAAQVRVGAGRIERI